MNLCYCRFQGWVETGSGKGARLQFVRKDGSSFYGIVVRNTLKVNHTPYSDEEWNNLDFENMKRRVCGGYRYKFSEIMVAVTFAPEDEDKNNI